MQCAATERAIATRWRRVAKLTLAVNAYTASRARRMQVVAKQQRTRYRGPSARLGIIKSASAVFVIALRAPLRTCENLLAPINWVCVCVYVNMWASWRVSTVYWRVFLCADECTGAFCAIPFRYESVCVCVRGVFIGEHVGFC